MPLDITDLLGGDLESRFAALGDLQMDSIAIDPSKWQEAAQALAVDSKATSPKDFASAIGVSYSEELRANAMVLSRYLEIGLGLAPKQWADAPPVVHGLVHHGDLEVSGDWSYWRFRGEPLCCLVTGNLRATGSISSSAFDGELMVGGNLSCASLVTDTELGVGGDVHCKYARLGWYDCTNSVGKLVADVYVDHGMTLVGEVDVRLRLECEDHDTRLPESEQAKLREALLPAVAAEILVSGDDEKIYEALDSVLAKRLVAGEAVFR